MRYTLLKALMSVAMIGLACAGMVHRTKFWASGIVALTFVLFTATAIRSFNLRKRAQSSAITFATVGTLYLIVVFCARPIGQCAIITNYPLAIAARQMKVEIAQPPVYSAGTTPVTIQPDDSMGTIIFQASQSDPDAPLGHFFLVGHCVWAWLFALAAGIFAACAYAERDTKGI